MFFFFFQKVDDFVAEMFQYLNIEYQREVAIKDNIVIVDIANILYLIKNNEGLINNLKNILPYSIIDVIPEKIELDKYLNYKETSEKEKSICIEDEYIRKIKTIKKGKEGSREFEVIGEKIIKLLFGDYIYNWKSQINCNDNLQRIDLIGKVKKQEGFWNMLYEIYKSRYIVFEFKNYNDEITQNEVYSTNKYLYREALRTVAIVISRYKMNANAKKICSEYMEKLLDDFLIGLAK